MAEAYNRVTAAANGGGKKPAPNKAPSASQGKGGKTASGGKFQEPRNTGTQPPRPAKQSGPKKKKKKGKGGAIAAACIAGLLLLGVGGVFLYDKLSDDGLILDNVYAAGINIGNMSKEEAAKAIEDATKDTYTAQNLTVELPDCKLVLSPEETKANLDVNKLVEDAWNYGRGGNVITRARARADAQISDYTFELMPYLNLDTDYIQGSLEQLSADVSSELTQPTVKVEGTRPPEKTENAEEDEDPEETENTAEAEGQKMTITMGTADRSIDTKALYDAIMKAYNQNDFTPIVMAYQETLPEQPDLQKIYDEYCTSPVDAVLDENTYDVTPEILGYGFILEDVQKQVDEAKEGQVIEVAFQTLVPKVTKEGLEDNLFKDILGQCSTDYSNIPNRTNNLILACEAIDGYIVKPGEVFSFNEVVGERTVEKGYKEATIYSGGLSVPGLGGGVCQVASTIYCCTLYADLEIVERTCHQYVAYYVPHWGMDATVYWGSLDFKFRNNTDYPIRIDADVSDGYVNVTLWGKDTKSYTVDIETEVIASYPWKTEYKEIREGSADWGKYADGEVIVTPYTGYKVETYKIRTDKETGESTREWEAESIFDTRNQLIAKVIKEETKPTDPPETDPPVQTDPPETDPPVQTDPPETDPPVTPPDEGGGDTPEG